MGFFGGNSQAFSAARNAAGMATQDANTLGTRATGTYNELNPFLTQELHAQHEFDPQQLNELLTAQGVGAGAAAGDAAANLNREAVRTRNASGYSKALDDIARMKMKSAAQGSENIAAQDVMGAKQLNQAGARGLQGLYGTDVSGQLNAMGQIAKDASTMQAAAGPSPFQDILSVGKLASQAAGVMNPASAAS